MSTKQMVEEIVRRNDITNMIVTGLFAGFLVLAFVLTIIEHREKMRQIKKERK